MPMATIIAAPAMTVAAATWPSSKRGTMTSFVTQRTAHDEATVARAKTVAPLTAMAKLRGVQPDLGADHPHASPPHDAGRVERKRTSRPRNVSTSEMA